MPALDRGDDPPGRRVQLHMDLKRRLDRDQRVLRVGRARVRADDRVGPLHHHRGDVGLLIPGVEVVVLRHVVQVAVELGLPAEPEALEIDPFFQRVDHEARPVDDHLADSLIQRVHQLRVHVRKPLLTLVVLQQATQLGKLVVVLKDQPGQPLLLHLRGSVTNRHQPTPVRSVRRGGCRGHGDLQAWRRHYPPRRLRTDQTRRIQAVRPVCGCRRRLAHAALVSRIDSFAAW